MKVTLSRSVAVGILLAFGLAACDSGEHVKASLIGAQQAYERGDYEVAGQIARNLLAESKEEPGARLIFGRALLAAGNARAAEAEFRRALQAGAAPAPVYPLLAKALVAAGESKRALDEFSVKAVGSSPDQLALKVELAEAQARSGDLKTAKASIRQVLEQDPGHVAARIVDARLLAGTPGGIATALESVEAALRSQPDAPDALRLKAELLLHGQRDAAGAVKVLNRLVDGRPREIDGRVLLVQALMLQGQPVDAKKAFEALQAAHPNNLSTLLLDSQLAFNAGNYAQAKEKALALLKAAPDHPTMSVVLGASQLALGDLTQAEQTLSRALYLDKNSAGARRYLAGTRMKLGRPEQVLEVLAPLLQGNEPDTVALGLAAEAKMAEGKFSDAERLYARMLERSPGHVGGQVAQAQLQLAQGQRERAMASLVNLAKDVGGPTVYGALISAHIKQAEFDKALAVCAEFAGKAPTSPLPLLLEARVRALTGDRDGQAKAFSQALIRDKQNFQATVALALLERRAGNLADARKRLETFAEAQPQNAQGWIALAAMEASAGTKGLAAEEAVLRRADERLPTSPELRVLLVQNLLRQRNHTEALAVAAKAAASFKGRPDVTEVVGAAQVAAGELNQAQKSYAYLATLLPADPRPLHALARTQLAAGNADQAIRTIVRAVEMAPGAGPLTLSALRLVASAKGAGATSALVAGFRSKYPQAAWPHVAEAELLLEQGQREKALAAFKAGFDKQPSTLAAIGYHGSLLNLARLAEAKSFASGWVKQQPKDSVFLRHLADRASIAGDTAEAERLYIQALAVSPRDAITLNNLAWSMIQRKDARALDVARQAVAAAPAEPVVMDTYASALQLAGKSEAALEVLQQLVAEHPGRHLSRLSLAKTLLSRGEKASARVQLEELNKLGAGFARQAEVGSLLAGL